MDELSAVFSRGRSRPKRLLTICDCMERLDCRARVANHGSQGDFFAGNSNLRNLIYLLPWQATLSINGLWGVLSQLGVKLTPIEREEVKASLKVFEGV